MYYAAYHHFLKCLQYLIFFKRSLRKHTCPPGHHRSPAYLGPMQSRLLGNRDKWHLPCMNTNLGLNCVIQETFFPANLGTKETENNKNASLITFFQGQPGLGRRILLKQKWDDSGISWANMPIICTLLKQITTLAPHHSVFVQVKCFFCCQTNSDKAMKDQWNLS